MCELPTATSSDTDEEELHQNIFNAFLDIFTSMQLGYRLEAYLTEEEAGRIGLSRHLALDCLCESLLPITPISEQDV